MEDLRIILIGLVSCTWTIVWVNLVGLVGCTWVICWSSGDGRMKRKAGPYKIRVSKLER